MFEKTIGSGMLCGLVACATDPRPSTDEPDGRGQLSSAEPDAGSAGRVIPAPSALPYARGGRRLRAQHYVVDGAEKFRGLYDAQLEFACEFAPDVSGAGVHCVPKNVVSPRRRALHTF